MTLRLAWSTARPRALADALRALIWPVSEPGAEGRDPSDRRIAMTGGSIEIVAAAGSDRLELVGIDVDEWPGVDPIDAEGAEVAGDGPGSPGEVDLLALGWATVDADRAEREVAARLGLPTGAFGPARDDPLLGARVRVSTETDVAIAVLEPATEGRLAAALARRGEGPCALYLGRSRSSDWMPGPPPTSGSRALPGPLGTAWLAYAAGPSGPFVLRVVGPERATDPRSIP